MKLKLNVDDLRVDTFETDRAPAGERGTVRANARPGTGGGTVYSGWWSCIPDASCQDTCGLSCNPSCVATYGECCPES